jgi:hypothetical protein
LKVKLPRDIDGPQLVKALRVLAYEKTRQTRSHIRVTTLRDGENHEVVTHHRPIKTGTPSSIFRRIAAHHNMSVEGIIASLEL